MPEPEKVDDKEKADDAPALPKTQEELEAFVEAALEQREKERREKAKAKKDKEKKRQQAEEDDEDEDDEDDPADIIRKAETRAATAEQQRDEARREALMAKVENKLRDHLAMNMREFIGNAPDIMLHIERAITPDAKEGEIARLIESHSKAFAERTKAVRKPASGAPVGGARTRTAVGGTDDPDQRRTADRVAAAKPEVSSSRPFQTINWHG